MADIDILQYALTLEHLEAEMYRQAIASGKLSGKGLEYAQTFGAEEAAHVDALSAAIRSMGGTPVAKRQSYNFPNFAAQDQNAVLGFISTIEDTGVGAYLGQVGAIQSGQLLGAAAGIYAVEALHTAAIRTLLGRDANPNGAVEKPLTMQQVLAAAGPLLGPEASPAAASPPAAAPAAAPSATAPTQLPRTGGVAVLPLLAAGAGLAALGKAMHRRAPRPTDGGDAA